MRVHRIIERTGAEGPGTRLCVWVQGCGHGCRGCYAKATWDPAGGTEIDSLELVRLIRKNHGTIDGITLLGGEPFDQAAGLLPAAAEARESGLNVIAFSGYLYEELLEKSGCRELLRYVDLLIDGAYIEEKRDFSRPLAGSSNQRFIYLTDRISEREMQAYRNRMELRIGGDGRLIMNGMADLGALSDIINMM